MKIATVSFIVAMALTPKLGWGAATSEVADAARRQDVSAVRALLRGGADVNSGQGDGMTALHWAAEHGNQELGAMLLYAGAKTDAGTRLGAYTPLHLAARRGHLEIARLLLQANTAAVDLRSANSGVTPLHLAALAGEPALVSLLVEAGADVNAGESSWGQTPLVFAASKGRTDVIEVLLEAGADPKIRSRFVDVIEREKADKAAEKRLSQFLAAFKEKQGGGADWQPTPAQVQAAIEASREIQRRWPNVPDPDCDEPKQDASGQAPGGPEEPMQKATGAASATGGDEPSASASASFPKEGCPAAKAATPEQTALAPEVDEASESTDISDSPDSAVVHDAGGEQAKEASVSDGPDSTSERSTELAPDTKAATKPKPPSYGELVGGWGGLSPLHHAVRQGHREASLALIRGGADINQMSAGDQTTPLLMAALNGQFDLALTLLDYGADPNRSSTAGATPLYAVLERVWAPRSSYAHPVEHQQQLSTHLDVMKALLEAGADPNVRLSKHLWYMEYTFSVLRSSGIHLEGATPFWRAAYALDLDALRLLKDYGADPSTPTINPPKRPKKCEKPEQPIELTESDESLATSARVNQDGEDSSSDGATPVSGEATASGDQPGENDVNHNVAPDALKMANAEGESSGGEPELELSEDEDDACKEEVDHSGVPVVPVGGPAINPLHAASGAGYGQNFAANAHRFVPGNWLATVKFLVEECGVDVNLRDANAYTALHHAASRGDNELVRYLVSRGADVTVVSRKGQTTADMANGPIQRVAPFPDTIELLVGLGSVNNNKCVSC